MQGNRGMIFESLIENTNKQYALKGIAQIQKVATPVKIIKTMPGGKLMACWDRKSTVDFVGCTKDGTYICFDAKETQLKNLPLKNIKEHQLKHLHNTHRLGGKAFLVVWFREERKCFNLPYKALESFISSNASKSIPLKYFIEHGQEVSFDHPDYIVNYLMV